MLGFFNAIGVMLTSVDHARLRLNALVLQHPCEPYDQLLHRIGRHYIYQVRARVKARVRVRVRSPLHLPGAWRGFGVGSGSYSRLLWLYLLWLYLQWLYLLWLYLLWLY